MSLEAARRVKAHGGVIHFFLVARASGTGERRLAEGNCREGHRMGNHTYDHVYVLAKTPAGNSVSFRTRAVVDCRQDSRSKSVRENVKLCIRCDQSAARRRSRQVFARPADSPMD